MDISVFKKMKLVVSTPMYRPEVCAAYKRSYVKLMQQLHLLTVSGKLGGYWEHESHDTYLPRARNVLMMHMLDTDATHHLLLDSDMGFDVDDVIRMLYHCAADPDYEVMGAAYPQKCIDWKRVKEAVLANPLIRPDQLEAVAPGSWTFKGLSDGNYNLGLPVELTGPKAHVATGIMVISRSVYEAFKKTGISYTDQQSGNRAWRAFHCDIDRERHEWVGEDVWFCREWKKLGGKIWLAPWVKTLHQGAYGFVGDISKVVDAGVELPQ